MTPAWTFLLQEDAIQLEEYPSHLSAIDAGDTGGEGGGVGRVSSA